MLELYENIKKFRKQSGLTQDELAKLTGYTDRSSIAKIEKGEVDLPQSKIFLFASALNVTAGTLMGNTGISDSSSAIRIPVYGRVAAGIPMSAVENILDWEEIPASWPGEHACLKVRGRSMEPRICEGDVIVVQVQDWAESGDIVVAMINGDEATVKKLIKQPDGIVLQPFNPSFESMYFTNAQIETMPVQIWGKVVENRAKF